MRGVVLPGDSSVRHVEVPVPTPGSGEVLLRMQASSICGSDIRAIYREHLGQGAEAYQDVVAGHEPCGRVEAVGDGVQRLRPGNRVVVYHITGCGQCSECRRGYEVGCHSPLRAAHGWQRDGGHAEYMVAAERSCLTLPEPLTYVDGALVSCGFGTAYEALLKAEVSGRDALLVTGLGPVGLATAMLGRALGAELVVGLDPQPSRVQQARDLALVDHAETDTDALSSWLAEHRPAGVEAAIDCSGHARARRTALELVAAWGRVVLVGEGGTIEFPVSDLLIHKQVRLIGSWVTSLLHMEELLERLVRWELHPEVVVTHRMPLDDAGEAYRLADEGAAGKVCLVMDETVSPA